jgi:mRNA-degrading endonuclease RelE of RelBE toxin-antitoxin system
MRSAIGAKTQNRSGTALEASIGKPLERELKGYWSLRVGRYRIIYRPDKAGAEIAAIGPARTIYEEIKRARRKD